MKRILTKLCHCLLMLPALFYGCVSLERSYPDKRYFVIGVSRDGNPANPAGSGVLQVSNVRVSPRFEGKSFVYRTTETSYESDFYNEFLVSPASLLAEEVRKGLARSQIFQYVINPTSQLEPTHTLEGTVNSLYGDFRDAGSPKAVLEMEFFLSKESPSKAEIVTQKRYSRSVDVNGRTPEALVKGWNEALEAILNSLVADLKSANF